MRRALRFARRHWLRLGITAVLTGLTVNAWAQAGTTAFLVLSFASIGCAVVIALTGLVATASVVRAERRPLPLDGAAKATAKELTR